MPNNLFTVGFDLWVCFTTAIQLLSEIYQTEFLGLACLSLLVPDTRVRWQVLRLFFPHFHCYGKGAIKLISKYVHSVASLSLFTSVSFHFYLECSVTHCTDIW